MFQRKLQGYRIRPNLLKPQQHSFLEVYGKESDEEKEQEEIYMPKPVSLQRHPQTDSLRRLILLESDVTLVKTANLLSLQQDIKPSQSVNEEKSSYPQCYLPQFQYEQEQGPPEASFCKQTHQPEKDLQSKDFAVSLQPLQFQITDMVKFLTSSFPNKFLLTLSIMKDDTQIFVFLQQINTLLMSISGLKNSRSFRLNHFNTFAHKQLARLQSGQLILDGQVVLAKQVDCQGLFFDVFQNKRKMELRIDRNKKDGWIHTEIKHQNERIMQLIESENNCMSFLKMERWLSVVQACGIAHQIMQFL